MLGNPQVPKTIQPAVNEISALNHKNNMIFFVTISPKKYLSIIKNKINIPNLIKFYVVHFFFAYVLSVCTISGIMFVSFCCYFSLNLFLLGTSRVGKTRRKTKARGVEQLLFPAPSMRCGGRHCFGVVSWGLGLISHYASMGLVYLPRFGSFMLNVAKYIIHGCYGYEI